MASTDHTSLNIYNWCFSVQFGLKDGTAAKQLQYLNKPIDDLCNRQRLFHAIQNIMLLHNS